jgi:hypothetical protein
MICRNVRCEAPRQRGSDSGARAGSPDRARRAPILHQCSVALAQDAGDGRIGFPISFSYFSLLKNDFFAVKGVSVNELFLINSGDANDIDAVIPCRSPRYQRRTLQ